MWFRVTIVVDLFSTTCTQLPESWNIHDYAPMLLHINISYVLQQSSLVLNKGSCPDDNLVIIGGTIHYCSQKLKMESYHDTNFVVTDSTASCHDENL